MDDRGPVFRLMYRSRLVVASPRRTAEITAIVETSRRRNADLAVTGALLVWQEDVVQTLEGQEDVVRGLFAAIAADDRHEDVTLVEARTVEERVFGRWSMARVAEVGPRTEGTSLPADGDVIGCSPDGERRDTDLLVATMRGHAGPR